MKPQVFKPMEFCDKCNCYYEKHCSEHKKEDTTHIFDAMKYYFHPNEIVIDKDLLNRLFTTHNLV